ncbi:hypothetical protein WKW79_18080 [Variovorax robiniae]|uniref:Uncharacterized protein n=1 Tax=Variovorax robiniae TaxID=1836199 RepID=A0ABU8XBQ4_9BURK
MKTAFRLAATTLSLIACIVALGAVATLLYDAIMGTRQNFGTLGILMLVGLLVGQLRILWVLLQPGTAEEPKAPYTPAIFKTQARPR